MTLEMPSLFNSFDKSKYNGDGIGGDKKEKVREELNGSDALIWALIAG